MASLTTAGQAADLKAIRAALIAASGSVRGAAAALDPPLHPSTLHRQIDALGLRDWLTATYPRSDRQPARKPRKAAKRGGNGKSTDP